MAKDIVLQKKSVDSGAATIVYHVAGDGPAICLLASTGRSGGDDFKELAHALILSGHRVIVPEPRGIGGSSGPLEGIDFHDLAADAMSAIRAETDAVIIAGHAYGCWIARTVANDYPGIVRGLALIAAGAGPWPPELSQAIDLLAGGEATRDARLAALRLAFFAPGNDPEPWIEGWHADVIAAQRAARAATDRESWWGSGSAPILDLVALQDPFRPPASRDVYRDEFGARVIQKTIANASHALPHEKPDEVARILSEWAATLI